MCSLIVESDYVCDQWVSEQHYDMIQQELPQGSNYGYHGGDLSYKSEGIGSLMKGGEIPWTGYFFYSELEHAKSRGNRLTGKTETCAVDFSQYNLWKPKDTTDYLVVEKTLKRVPASIDEDGEEEFNNLMYRIERDENERKDTNPLKNSFIENKELIKQNLIYVSEQLKAGNYSMEDPLDKPATTIMKTLGYEGIDLRKIKVREGDASVDASTHGSVIFDLKRDTYICTEQ
jgi:hypothetical protein